MGIEAKGSHGIFAECPNCHHSIPHGFQVCQECGHIISASEQAAMQVLWLKTLLKSVVVIGCLIGLGFYLVT